MKYFEIDRIKEAIEQLQHYRSIWVLGPLVLAVNKVGDDKLTDISDHKGSDKFLDLYFNGKLIGLPDFPSRTNALWPRFQEIDNVGNDYVIHQGTKIWANAYSRRGYKEMRDRGEISGTGSKFKLEGSFADQWRTNLRGDFRFEDLLVWLYAFHGVEDQVTSWDELANHFQDVHLGNGERFKAPYSSVFKTSGVVPWPNTFLESRPSNEAFQRELIPSKLSVHTDLSHLLTEVHKGLQEAGLFFIEDLTVRFLAAVLSKRLVILTGLSGSGKTKLAQALARWFTAPLTSSDSTSSYALIPVGADWTGNDNILGYPDGLDPKGYVTRPALELIRHAIEHPDVPHFLILDEMNLSHVERYFADLLSATESGEEIPLYVGDPRQCNGKEVPQRLRVPKNLFVMGTVNVDETTYMFSPKVLDRANVIEFRTAHDELRAFIENPKAPDVTKMEGLGAGFGKVFVDAAASAVTVPESVKQRFEAEMMLFFDLLREHRAEFGYRVTHEAARFVHFYHRLGSFPDDDTWFDEAFDAIIVQKFLPKMHGSRSKLEGLL